MKLLTFSTIILLSAGVAHAKEPNAKSTAQATIHIYRNKAIAGALYGFRLKINDEKLKIKNNHCYSFRLDPGQTTIKVRTAGHKTVTLNVEPGKDYYIKSYMQAGMFWNKVELAEVTPTFAAGQVNAIKEGNKKLLEL